MNYIFYEIETKPCLMMFLPRGNKEKRRKNMEDTLHITIGSLWMWISVLPKVQMLIEEILGRGRMA
jgi:hypothetical protein